MNTHIEDKIFQDTPRRVAKFHKSRPRDVEKYVVGKKKTNYRMWANAQRDGRPVEYRWCRLTPTTRVPCRNAAKTRNPLKCAGVPQTRQQISAASAPYCEDMWGRYCCLTSFFRLSIYALIAKM